MEAIGGKSRNPTVAREMRRTRLCNHRVQVKDRRITDGRAGRLEMGKLSDLRWFRLPGELKLILCHKSESSANIAHVVSAAIRQI